MFVMYKNFCKILIFIYSIILILVMHINIVFATQIIEPVADDYIDISKMTLNSKVDLSKYYGLDIYDDEVATVIEDFISKYINNNMSDFEKEIKIIQYLVENIDYDYENLLNFVCF